MANMDGFLKCKGLHLVSHTTEFKDLPALCNCKIEGKLKVRYVLTSEENGSMGDMRSGGG